MDRAFGLRVEVIRSAKRLAVPNALNWTGSVKFVAIMVSPNASNCQWSVETVEYPPPLDLSVHTWDEDVSS